MGCFRVAFCVVKNVLTHHSWNIGSTLDLHIRRFVVFTSARVEIITLEDVARRNREVKGLNGRLTFACRNVFVALHGVL